MFEGETGFGGRALTGEERAQAVLPMLTTDEEEPFQEQGKQTKSP